MLWKKTWKSGIDWNTGLTTARGHCLKPRFNRGQCQSFLWLCWIRISSGECKWGVNGTAVAEAAVVNVSYGETKLQTYSMNLMRKLKVVLRCLPVLKRSRKITSWEMIRAQPGLWQLGVPLAQRKPTAVSHYWLKQTPKGRDSSQIICESTTAWFKLPEAFWLQLYNNTKVHWTDCLNQK